MRPGCKQDTATLSSASKSVVVVVAVGFQAPPRHRVVYAYRGTRDRWLALPVNLSFLSCQTLGVVPPLKVMVDVTKSLALVRPANFVQSFNRTNLLFRVDEKPDKAADAMEYVADFIKKQNRTIRGG